MLEYFFVTLIATFFILQMNYESSIGPFHCFKNTNHFRVASINAILQLLASKYLAFRSTVLYGSTIVS